MAVYLSICIAIIVLLFQEGFGKTLESVDSIATCTHSVNVPRENGRCSPGSYESVNIDSLQALLSNQHAILDQKLDLITNMLVGADYNDENNDSDESSGGNSLSAEDIAEDKGTIGIVYTHWGRTTCPETAETIYQGFVGKSHHNHGGGVNYLCLPREPEFPEGVTAGYQSQSYVYGTEYEHQNSPMFDSSHHDNDVPCAVCDVNGRSRVLMIPAKLSCPAGWVKEYQGLLMAQHHKQKGSDYICVANEMEDLAGGALNQGGGLLYVVESVCGSLKCPPYTDGYEIACILCSK